MSKDDTFGDLLNDYEKKEKVKVGVLTCGYFEYWRMYPETLEAFVRADLDVVMLVERKGEKYEKGTYPIEVYVEGKMVGSANLELSDSFLGL